MGLETCSRHQRYPQGDAQQACPQRFDVYQAIEFRQAQGNRRNSEGKGPKLAQPDQCKQDGDADYSGSKAQNQRISARGGPIARLRWNRMSRMD